MVRGAMRLMRRPFLSCCSKRFASRRPWRARASRGERAGGASPVRGLGRSEPRDRLLMLALARFPMPRLLLVVVKVLLVAVGGSKDCERKSRPPGRCCLFAMVKAD
jgi:hypothetical protein